MESRKKQRILLKKLENALYQTQDVQTVQFVIKYFTKRKISLTYHPFRECFSCGSPFGEKLNCEHFMCQICLEEQLLRVGKGKILKHNLAYLECSGCKQIINQSLALEIYRNKAPVSVRERQEPKKEPTIACPICMTEFPIQEIVTLECEHKFCKGCTQMYIQTKVEEGKTNLEDYPCPSGLCQNKEAFTQHIIISQLSEELKEKYYHFTLGNLENLASENDDQIYKVCPRCQTGAYIPKNLKQVYCCKPGCPYRFCPKCFQDYHHGLTCEQYEAKQNKITKKNLKGISKLRSCPVCNVSIEKNGGCKYIACSSRQCQGKTYFCFSCGQLLKSKHQMHNCPDSSEPFSNRCGIF